MIVPVRRFAGMASARLMLVKAAAAAAPARKLRRVVILNHLGLKRVEKTDRDVWRRLGALRGVGPTGVPARVDGDVNNLFPKEFIMSFSQYTVIAPEAISR
jgi:hypothetical protein